MNQRHMAARSLAEQSDDTNVTDARDGLLSNIRPLANYETIQEQERAVARHSSVVHLPMNPRQQAALQPNEVRQMINPRAHMDDPARDIRSKEYKIMSHQFFLEAFKKEEHSLDDLTPYRIRAVYRIVREMARLKNLCAADEPINRSLCLMPDGTDPYLSPSTNWMIENYSVYGIAFEKFLNRVYFVPTEELCWCMNSEHETMKDMPIVEAAGLPLCPPSPPLKYIEIGPDDVAYILKEYDPRNDTTLTLFIDLVKMIVDYLQLGAGTKNDPESGFLGLQGLLNPNYIRLAWPTRTELFAFEFMLLDDIVNMMVKEGFKSTREKLRDCYGLTEGEIDGHMRMARSLAKTMTEMDMDEDRAISILRIEEYSKRARETLDLKAEMNAIKQAAMISGLTKVESTDQSKDFFDVVKRVSAKAARKAAQQVLDTPNVPQGTTRKELVENFDKKE